MVRIVRFPSQDTRRLRVGRSRRQADALALIRPPPLRPLQARLAHQLDGVEQEMRERPKPGLVQTMMAVRETAHVRFGSKADLSDARRDVRLVPLADIAEQTRVQPIDGPRSQYPHATLPLASPLIVTSRFVQATAWKRVLHQWSQS